jgi:Zn-dependent peptidase ImmA (M78 family)
MQVPWLAREEITGKARELLIEYESATGCVTEPPIPVADIIQTHLGLKLAYMDFEKSLGLRGVLGATYVKARLICVNKDLQERESEGRMAFTCAHEVGHWVLHRQFVDTAGRSDGHDIGILCRSADARKPIEWQADFFAACLLMPEDKVRKAFRAVCGPDTLVINNVKSSFGGTSVCIDPCVENWHLLAQMACEAGGFLNVSKQAMIIRLQELGLLRNLAGEKIGWKKRSAG